MVKHYGLFANVLRVPVAKDNHLKFYIIIFPAKSLIIGYY